MLSYLLPNWNKAAITAMILGVIGFFMIWLSSNFWWNRRLSRMIRTAGVFIIIGGAAYWIIVSFFEDVWANKKLVGIIASAAGVGLFGYVLLREPKKKGKRNMNRK